MLRAFMPSSVRTALYVCARCLRANQRLRASRVHPSILCNLPVRRYVNSVSQRRDESGQDGGHPQGDEKRPETREFGGDREEGAMTRRMRQLSEEALEAGGRSSEKAISEAGFSEDLKKQLEERIASANFRAEHRSAFAEVEMPSYAGQGARDVAIADGWTGEESIHDASLRMLNDAHKPLRTGRASRIPSPAAPLPKRVDTGRSASGAATGTRLANARDRTTIYSSLKDSDMDAQEREKRFQELKARFQPEARSVVPGTIQGLSNLANQRIEDAIARGQFKNLPSRGKKIERDYNASNPFLDTTEYFMNKMIQKQEIVPPWIEKQQELVSAATKFRSRLRNDWKRHAARMIASKGGTLQEQMRRAEAFAKAELLVNPLKKAETLNTVDASGHLSQISLSGELKVSDSTSPESSITEEVVAELVDLTKQSSSNSQLENAGEHQPQSVEVNIHTPTSSVPPAPYPFRDPAWEQTESAYHTLSINDLNSKARSYNLQAPDLAKKPYYSLTRELNACYADVAPQLANAIRERTIKPQRTIESFGDALSGQGGVVDRLVGQRVRVRDERTEKQYGFRQFWKDVWGNGKPT